MDDDKKSAIVKWVNCINVGPILKSLSDLWSGRHFISIIGLLNANLKDTVLCLENWVCALETFLKDSYGESLDIDFKKLATAEDELEVAKATVLLLSFSINSEAKSVFVDPLTKLDDLTQIHIKEIIQAVLLGPPVAQNPKCFEILQPKGNGEKPESDSRIKMETDASDVHCYEGSTFTPIKCWLQSPEMCEKLTSREKERQIGRLRAELEAEATSRSYIESDLKKAQETIESQNSKISHLRLEISELIRQCNDKEDYRNTLENQKEEIQRLLLRCQRLVEKQPDYDNLKTECNFLSRENEALIKKLQGAENAHRSCATTLRRCQELEINLEAISMALQEKEEDIEQLKKLLSERGIQLLELESLYNEKVMLFEHATAKQSETSGETMCVVHDVIRLEESLKQKETALQDCIEQIEHLKAEVDQNKNLSRELAAKMAEIEEIKLVVSIKNEEIAKLESMKTETALHFEELNAEMSTLKEELQKYQDKISVLKQTAHLKDEALKENKTQLEKSKSDLVKMSQAVAKKNCALNKLKEDHSIQKDCLMRDLAAQKTSYDNLQHDHELDKAKFKNECTMLDAKVTLLTKELDCKSKCISELEKQVKDQECKVNGMLSEKGDLEKLYQNQVDDLKEKNQRMKQTINDFENDIGTMKNTIEQLKQNITELAQGAKAANDKLVQSRLEYKTSLAKKEKMIETLSNDLVKTEDSCKKLVSIKSELELRVQTLTLEKEQADSSLLERKEVMDRLMQACKKYEVINQNLQQDMDGVMKELQESQKAHILEIESLHTESQNKIHAIEMLRDAQCLQVLSQIEAADAQCKQLQSEKEQLTLDMEAECEMLQKKTEDLLRDVQRKEEETIGLRHAEQDLKAQVSELQLQIEAISEEKQRFCKANQLLEGRCQWLQAAVDRSRDFYSAQDELAASIKQMQEQVIDSEKKHVATVGLLKGEIKAVTEKYEMAKEVISDLMSQQESLSDQLAHAVAKSERNMASLNQMTILLKSEQDNNALCKSQLVAEQKKTWQLTDRVQKLESELRARSTELFKRQEAPEVTRSLHSSTQSLAPSNSKPTITVTCNSAENFTLHFDDDKGLKPEYHLSSLSINSKDQDMVRANWTYNMPDQSALSSIHLAPGTGNCFPCEDEEGEFFNVSYLDDLRNGRCETRDHPGRLSELQRRNTLYLPHLRSSYPVETQMVPYSLAKDEELKSGSSRDDVSLVHKLESTAISDVTQNSDSQEVRRKLKPIQPTYNKPGPPTPGKSSKAPAPKVKSGKTPTSLKKLLKRPPFLTPSRFKNGSPKRTQENVPPRLLKDVGAKRNIAFTVGFSPKVKSQTSSLTLSNQQKQTSTPQQRKTN